MKLQNLLAQNMVAECSNGMRDLDKYQEKLLNSKDKSFVENGIQKKIKYKP